MRKVVGALCVLLVLGLLAACQGTKEEVPLIRTAKGTYPDPPPPVADAITTAVGQWVADRADESGVYDIPARGGKNVAGSMADFHTVQQKDDDTYTVCVDFQDGDNLYDVDFFVDRTEDGLIVREAYLHKINGEVVSG
jgi:hypothetical protein